MSKLTLVVSAHKPEVASASVKLPEAEAHAYAAKLPALAIPRGFDPKLVQVRVSNPSRKGVCLVSVWVRKAGTLSAAQEFYARKAAEAAAKPATPARKPAKRNTPAVRTSYACVKCGTGKLPKPGACAPCVSAWVGKPASKPAVASKGVLVF